MSRPNFKIRSFASVKRLMKEAHIIIQVCDARDIAGTRTFNIEGGMQSKMLIAATKADLISPEKIGTVGKTLKGMRIVYVSPKKKGGVSLLMEVIRKMAREKRERIRKKAPNSPKLQQAIRVVVFGIPNVGKSSLINALAKRKAAKTGFRSGVTRGHQWIKIGSGILLYDTPGVLNLKEKNDELALKSAVDAEKVKEPEVVACRIISKFIMAKDKSIFSRYKLSPCDDAYEFLEILARKRGLLGKGGAGLTGEAAKIVIRDYQKGKFVLKKGE